MSDPTISPGGSAATPPGGASEPAAGGPGAPGVEAHVAGQDTSQATAAGEVPGGAGLDASTGPYAPSEDVLGSSGDSMGDDDVIPQRGDTDTGALADSGSVTSDSPASEPPD